ncbi:MAG: glycosyl hydrolase family 18 protein [Candidatus Dojkabacteria bacterium]
MNKKFYIGLILTITILIAAEGAGAYYFYKHPIKETVTEAINNKVYVSSETEADLEYQQLDSINKQPKNLSDVYVTGWIPDWDIPNGLSTLKDQVSIFKGVSPVWFYLEDDGSLKETPYSNGPDLTDFASSKNLDLVPSIALFDAATISKVLNDEVLFNKHIDNIVNMAVDNNYKGIDLDYESVYLSDKTLFFNFLKTLSQRLKDKGKLLSFTVLPKWGDQIDYPTLPQTRRVEDYKRISDLVDEFRIMTYDFFGRSSSQAGPVAPLKWMEYVLKYAIKDGVPRDKILLGIPTYSYDWTERPLAPDDIDVINWYGNLTPNTLENGVAYFNKQVNQVRSNYTLTEKFNSVWGEVVGTYNYKGENRIIVFPNEDSLKLRKQLAADYGIKGITYWRIGGEDGLKLQ